jgi:peroxiredoxin Q/BCP
MYWASAMHIRLFNPPLEPDSATVQPTTPAEILSSLLEGQKTLKLSRWFEDGKRIRIETRQYMPPGQSQLYGIGSINGDDRKSYVVSSNDDIGHGELGESVGMGGTGITGGWMGNLSSPDGLISFLLEEKPQGLGEEEINGLKTIKIKAISTFDAEHPVTYWLWLAPDRSYRELRKRMEVVINGQYVTRQFWYEPLNFIKFRDIWIPQKGVAIDYLVDKQGGIHWRSLDWFELLDIQPLESDQRSVFDFEFPVGARVSDLRDPKQPQYSVSGGDPKQYFNPKAYFEVLQAKEKPVEERVPKDVWEFVQRVVASAKPLPGQKEAALLPRAEDDPQTKLATPRATVQVGQVAPDFNVVDANGKPWKLSGLRGKKAVVLTFFPKCFTGGCANHLSSLRDHQAEFDAANAQIFAVSVDPAEGEAGQKAFAAQWKLAFPLIPDTQRVLCKLYGAAQRDDEHAARMTFLIDKRGIVRFIDTNINVKTHGADVLAKLHELGMAP